MSAALLAGLVACGGSDEAPSADPLPDAGDASSAGGSAGTAGTSGASGASGAGNAAADAAADAPVADAGPGCGTTRPDATKVAHEIQSSGQARKFFVHVPPGYDANTPAMVVLVFHGYLETAEQIDSISEMSQSSDRHGFLAVYPQGISNAWNAGRCCGTAASSQRPDVQFVADLLDELEASYCVDRKRIYAAGFSNGGMLSQRLACELSQRIAAIGPVAGPLAIEGCAPSRPVPVIEFHGTSDWVVPYNGGGFARVQSVPDTIAFWAQADACTDAQPTVVYDNGDSSCVEHRECAAGSAVRLCTVDGGGHQWPGGTSSGSPGKLTQDIDASEQMVEFFTAHPMP
jgi:polyhydroxybutyrate depolymerase